MSADPIGRPTAPLQLDWGTANGRTVLRCSGKLIAGATEYFVAEAKRLAERSSTLMLDLGGLTYIDSTGLGAPVSVYTSVRRAQCEFRLVNVSPRIMELLRMTNLEKVLQPTDENLL